jgi:hypothetical protein
MVGLRSTSTLPRIFAKPKLAESGSYPVVHSGVRSWLGSYRTRQILRLCSPSHELLFLVQEQKLGCLKHPAVLSLVPPAPSRAETASTILGLSPPCWFLESITSLSDYYSSICPSSACACTMNILQTHTRCL